MRKFALRGLIAVLVTVALCMFFSGTIENITTPKVKTVRPSRGKLTEKLELDATLAYPETEDVGLALPSGQTLTITKVNVRAGYPVSAGDVVLEATVTGYDEATAQARDAYDAALDERMEVERKNAGIVLRRTEQLYADSYAALRSATRETARAQTDMEVLLREEKLSYREEGYPTGASGELHAAIDAYREAAQRQEEAQTAFNRAARYGVSDAAWSYITELQSAQEKMDDCAGKLVELEQLQRDAAQLCAPHDGVIAGIDLRSGDPYDGSLPLYRITAEGSSPALRAELADVERTISEGMEVTLPNGTEAEVTGVGYTDTGVRCADVAVTEEIIRREDSIYSLSLNGSRLTFLFTARESTTLLPASAVRGSGDSRYVYVVNERQTSFGAKKYSISKQEVHVLGEADGVASVEEELGYYDIAYMEDRALTEGSDVMHYAE